MDLVHLLASWLRSLFHFLICMKFAQFLATSCSERICADFVEVRMTEYCDNHFDMTMCKTCFCVCFLKLEREREKETLAMHFFLQSFIDSWYLFFLLVHSSNLATGPMLKASKYPVWTGELDKAQA